MLTTQAPELSLAQPEAAGQGVDASLVEGSQLDQRKRAGHRVRRAPPGALVRRRLRPAPQARAEPRLLCRGRRGIEGHVLRSRRARRTDRAAVGAGRLHSGEEAAVEPSIAQLERAVARVVIEVHPAILPWRAVGVWRFSDVVIPDRGTIAEAAAVARGRYLVSRFGLSSKRKSQCEAPSITVCVRVSFTAGLKPSTSEKSRLQESSAPTSGMPRARYISAYRHRVTLNENFSSVCSSTSMR